jgi:1-acyl-sn-glycerol-3-phosphate acyltransferase
MNRILLMVLRNLHIVPGAWFKLCHYAKHTDEYSFAEKYAHIQKVLWRVIHSGKVDLQVHGLENIPQEGGFLMYGNHQGMFDIVAIGATCDVPMAAVFKKELLKAPLVKEIIACTKSYAMDREDVRQSLTVIQAVTREVQNGRPFLIFPEGTRSKNGNKMNEFHGGSFRCALKSKCPIVPICYIDCFKPLDQKGSAPLTCQMHYLPVIPYEEYKDLDTVALAALVKSRIQACLDENT